MFSLLAQPQAITGESPLWDAARGCLWWIDIQAQRLLRTTPDGTTSAVALPWQPGFAALAESGRLVLGLETGLWLYDPGSGALDQVSDTESSRPTVRLNDGKPDALGRLWFGSMDMTGQGLALGRLYRRDPDGSIHILREGITVPNAIVPAEDGRALYFTDSPTGILERLAVEPVSGAILDSTAICRFDPPNHPDGACLDSGGNIWIALIGSGEVVRMAPDGTRLASFQLPAARATMPMLGGENGSTLFVTNQRRFLSAQELAAQPGAGGLYAMETDARAGPVHRVAGL